MKNLIDKPDGKKTDPSNKYTNSKLCFPSLVAHGENPRLFRSVTPETRHSNNEIGKDRADVPNNLYDFDNSTNGSE